MQTVQHQLFPALLSGSIDFYHFIPLSLILRIGGGGGGGGGSQGQCKAKPIGFIFSHTFHMIRMKFDVVMMQFMLNIMKLVLSKI